MLYRVLYVIINSLAIFIFVNCEGIVEKSEKVSDGDLQTCYDGFVIHKNKIIRTQDSQQMGAKYLTEIDVNSESDCIRFCCVTDQCDVFVFEEKKPGNCYLFHCGPPQDFKCKFTDHANYSSAVLTNYKPQSAMQLEEQIRKTQEHELKSLRKHADPGLQEYSYNEPPPVVVTQVTQPPVVTTPVSVKPVCSRNQFECRTTGECIAIYNVCDGIPQCSDGSDEAGELHCPTEKPFPAPPPVVVQNPVLPSLPDVLRYQQMLQHHKSYAPLYGHVQESNPKSWQPSGSTHQVLPPQQNLPYPVDPESVPQAQSHASYGLQGYPWNYQPYYEQNKEGYNGYIYPLHDRNNVPVYEQQPHIFNHKRPGVIEEPAPDGNVDQSRSFVPYYQQPNHETWQEKQPEVQPTVAPVEHHIEPEVVHQNIRTTSTPAPCKTSEKEANLTKKSDGNEANGSKNPKVVQVEHKDESTTRMKSVEKGHASVKIEVKKDEGPQVDHKLLEDHLKEAKKENMVAEHFRFNSSVNENLRPKGAVISLALGLSVSAVMAILIACRLRVVKRRIHRGHEPYAHDADYLVNGMYL